ASLGRVLSLAKVTRFVRRNPKNPRMKLASSRERVDILYYREEHFLADFLNIFAGKIATELEYKTPCRRVMSIEQFVPGSRLPSAAAVDQLSFGILTHSE